MTLTWAVLVGTGAMMLFAEMAGRVTAVTRRPIFHVMRERLGLRASLLNATASAAGSATENTRCAARGRFRPCSATWPAGR
jgi:hypothetical protein